MMQCLIDCKYWKIHEETVEGGHGSWYGWIYKNKP